MIGLTFELAIPLHLTNESHGLAITERIMTSISFSRSAFTGFMVLAWIK